MDQSKQGETSGFQFLIEALACQGERLLAMRQGARRVLPHNACDLGQVPLRFRQHPPILTGLGHLPGFLQQRSHLGLVVRVLDRQDRQPVEGHADKPGQLVVLRIGHELFIGLLGLLPGVLGGIGPPQVGIEVFDLPGFQHGLYPLLLLQQGACLFVVPDGVCDRKDGQRLIPGLYTVARGALILASQERVVGQRGGRCSLGPQPRQGALVQDLPPRRA